MQERELGAPAATASDLPLRQAFVENLVRASLDGVDTIDLAAAAAAGTSATAVSAAALRCSSPRRRVEDAAEATLLLYDIADARCRTSRRTSSRTSTGRRIERRVAAD